MRQTRVYDLPTRFFHWSFAAGFLGAYFIVQTFDDDSPAYAYHMLLGLGLGALVLLRVIWGVVGSRYARFSSFQLNPVALARYFGQLASLKTSVKTGGKTARTPGHNPASSWAALIMMGCAAGLAITGVMMTSGGDKEFLEDVHEWLANIFIGVAIAHVLGVVFHSLRHRDGLGLSMVSGRKVEMEGSVEAVPAHRGVAFLFVGVLAVMGVSFVRNYDPQTQALRIFGNTLQLGEEGEGQSQDHSAEEGRSRSHTEEDED